MSGESVKNYQRIIRGSRPTKRKEQINVRPMITKSHLNDFGQGNLIVYVIENSEVIFRGILHGISYH